MSEERKQSIGEFEMRGVEKDVEYNAGEDIIQQYADLDLEGMKQACVNWINTAAMHSRNEDYWRERCLKAELAAQGERTLFLSNERELLLRYGRAMLADMTKEGLNTITMMQMKAILDKENADHD